MFILQENLEEKAFPQRKRVKTSDGIMIVDRLDFTRVQKLGGKHLQYACRYPLEIIYLHNIIKIVPTS